MAINNIYAMTDEAITKEIGSRIEQIRLEADLSQAKLAAELGISAKTYRAVINGNGKFELVIGVLRALKKLELVDNFIPEIPVSPIALLKLEGKKRRRASRKSSNQINKGEDIEW